MLTLDRTACEQALLFGRAKRAKMGREKPPLSRLLSRVYVSRYPPNGELARRLYTGYLFVPTRKAIPYRRAKRARHANDHARTLVARVFAARRSRAHVLSSLNLKRKRDCSQSYPVSYEHLFDICLSTLKIGAAQLLSVKSVLMREQRPYLVTVCDLKCLRVIEGFWLFSVKIS